MVSPTILVPGWTVSVAPLATFTYPLSVYTVSAKSVRLAVTGPVRIAAAWPVVAFTVALNALVSVAETEATR